MSFSTRAIALSAPPVSIPVRNLGLLLWSLPILFSSLALALSPLSAKPAPINSFPRSELANRLKTQPLPPLETPRTFARATADWEDGVIKPLPVGLGPRFSMVMTAWSSSAFAASKRFGRVDGDLPLAESSPAPATGSSLQKADIQQASRTRLTGEGATRDFQRVKVIGATMLHADNVNILLAGIEPLDENATCRRLDGVMQNCNERAQHRLAVLLQARTISCQMSRQLESGAFVARCLADKIDLAGDLLRQKLAQRPSSTLASNAP